MPQSNTRRLDPHRDPIYLAVGRCLEGWSWVEENLAFVLEGLLRHRRFGLVATGFGAIRSFESKLNMVDEIARRALGKRQLKRWNSLKGRLNKKYSKRNEVAHFSVLFHVNVREARLYPYWGITKGKPLVSRAEGLTAKDLEIRAESFSKLSSDVLKFYRGLPKRLGPRKAPPLPSA